MLERLEKSPHAVFSERQLTNSFPLDFERAKQDRMIRRLSGPPGVGGIGAYTHPSGRTYVVVPVENGYEAFDDEDPEADPVIVAPADLVQWGLDLAVLSQRIQEANGLRGQPEARRVTGWEGVVGFFSNNPSPLWGEGWVRGFILSSFPLIFSRLG